MPGTWSLTERAILAETLLTTGPGAPTLCAGWRTEHLAAHIVLRDRTPWALGTTMTRAAAATAPESYAALVAQVAEGPGSLAPGRWAGDMVNLGEFFVHTEDVRRAQPGAVPVQLEDEHAAALWKQVAPFSRLLLRRSPVGVVLVVDGGPRTHARKARHQQPTVVVTGTIEDLVLFSFGRGASTTVTFTGPHEAVSALTTRFPGPQ